MVNCILGFIPLKRQTRWPRAHLQSRRHSRWLLFSPRYDRPPTGLVRGDDCQSTDRDAYCPSRCAGEINWRRRDDGRGDWDPLQSCVRVMCGSDVRTVSCKFLFFLFFSERDSNSSNSKNVLLGWCWVFSGSMIHSYGITIVVFQIIFSNFFFLCVLLFIPLIITEN